jgi:type VI secretion system Hcp family effector
MGQDEANRIAGEAQRRRRLSGALRLALPSAAALGAGAAIAVAAIPGGGGTITGCYLTNTGNAPDLRIGQLRLIDPSLSPTIPGGGPNPAAVCLSDESEITWSQSGPTGPGGPPGATGAQGAPGAAGANGQEALLPAVQFGFDNSAGAMFLKLDGVPGGSSLNGYKNDIEISSFSFGASNPPASASTGSGAGRATFSSFTITKHLDKASPLLQQGSLSDKHYKEADILFARKVGQSQQDYLEMKLENVVISSYKLASGDGGAPLETVVLEGDQGEATFISGNARSEVLLTPQAS